MKRSLLKRYPSVFFNGFFAILCLLPLWLYRYIPSTDLPQHMAIGSIVYRLLKGDAAAHALYTLHFQWLSYHVCYLLLTPLMSFLGPFLGMRCFLSAIFLGIYAGVWRCLAVLGGASYLSLGSVFIFYGALFFWGFLPNLVGVPFFLFYLASMLALEKSYSLCHGLLALLLGALAAFSHIVFIPSCLAVVVVYGLGDLKKRWLQTGILSFLFLLPLAMAVLESKVISSISLVQFESPSGLWNHLRHYWAVADRSWSRLGHQFFWLLLLFLLGSRKRIGNKGLSVFLKRVFSIHILFILLVPVTIISANNLAWLLNVRYFAIAEILLVLMAAAVESHLRLDRRLLLALFVMKLSGVLLVFHHFNEQIPDLAHVAMQLQPNSRLKIEDVSRTIGFKPSWAPHFRHLSAYFVVYDKTLIYPDLFNNPHIPVQQKATSFKPYNYFLYQGRPQDLQAMAKPASSDLLLEGAFWRLYEVRTSL